MLDEVKSRKKTFFPSHWNWLRCLRSTIKAVKNIIKIKKGRNGELIVMGAVQNVLVIQLAVDSVSGKVKTFTHI